MNEEYRNYLQGGEWEARRKQFLRYCFDLERYFCWTCGEKDQKLFRVHHLTYKRIFQERMEDLTLLCDGCHQKFHEFAPLAQTVDARKKIEKRKRAIGESKPDSLYFVRQARASLGAINGNWQREKLTGMDIFDRWVESARRRNVPWFNQYLSYVEKNPAELDRISTMIKKMVKRREENRH